MESIFEDKQILTYLIFGVLCITLVGWWLGWMFEDLVEEGSTVDISHVGPIIFVMIPLARKVGANNPILKLPIIVRYTNWAGRNLMLSGMDDIMSAKEYVASHLVLLMIGIGFPMLLFVAMPDITPGYVVMLSGFLGILFFGLPFYFLHSIIEERKWGVFCGMPYLLDLLTLLVEAGMEFTLAIERASMLLGKGPLTEELKRFYKQLQLGQTRKKALTELGDRVELMEMKSFVTSLLQQEELGTPLGKVLRIQSEIMRFRRIQVAEEKANKAPTKILIPMILFIFPSVFLVLIGPLILKAQRGGR